MRLCRYERGDGIPALGVWRPEGVVPLAQIDEALPTRLDELMELGDALVDRLKGAESAPVLGEMPRLLAPVATPQKIVCIGLNYRDHAAETGVTPPDEPLIFAKFPSALIGPGDAIVLPSCSDQVDYEAELVVVIGRRVRSASVSDAMDAVFGYCCGHDVSARDWQKSKPGGQWTLGKSFDTFGPTGPFIAHKSLIPDPGRLRVQMRINGEVRQNSNTSQFIFSVPELISYVSRVVTLYPGDLIFTGTPPGVGMARRPPQFLQPGDECEVEIEGLGRLKNPCVAEQ